MTILGLMRVRNEARWITRALASMRLLCEQVLVMDDHSTDDTAALAAASGALVLPSPFSGLDESRDKQWLLERAYELAPEWCLMLDGDEALEPGAENEIRAALANNPGWESYSFRVLYLWDREDQVRVDKSYGKLGRPSLFRMQPGLTFRVTGNGGNFHCGSIPKQARPSTRLTSVILHYGYMHREDRIRKYQWYRRIDFRNCHEDGYRHIAQGDLPELPASAKFRWGGPLALRPLSDVLAERDAARQPVCA